MRSITKFLALFILTGISSLQADSLPLALRLKQNQEIKQSSTFGFDVYLEVSDQFMEEMKKENASRPTEQTALMLHGLSQLRKDKPACTGSFQSIHHAKVLENKDQYYTVSSKNRVNKFSLQESLLNNFALTFNADKPEKNFSNLPVPIDFKEIERAMNHQEAVVVQIAKNGTLVDITNLHQVILSRSAENGWSEDQTAQICAGAGLASLMIPQLKIACHLTGIRLPDSSKKIGESWIQPFITVPPMLEPSIPQRYLPLLELLNQKITLLEQEGSVAKFSVEFPATTSHLFPIPENEIDIALDGHFLKGTMKVNVDTGLIIDAEGISDFTLTISNTKDKDKMLNDLVCRFVATLGIETQ